jgi:protein-tyrosine phosphatase
MFRWVIQQQLARSPRPRIAGKRGQVPREAVKSWIKEAKRHGIRSVIVLLDDRQLRLYEELPAGLIPYYRAEKLNVMHVNAPNGRRPALSEQDLKEVWKAYQRLEKPALIHCSAGIGRTGAAVRFCLKKARIACYEAGSEKPRHGSAVIVRRAAG